MLQQRLREKNIGLIHQRLYYTILTFKDVLQVVPTFLGSWLWTGCEFGRSEVKKDLMILRIYKKAPWMSAGVRERRVRDQEWKRRSHRSVRTGHGINCFRLRRLLWQIQTICSIECAEKLITQAAGFESSVRERKEWKVKMEKRNTEGRDLGTPTSELRIAT